MSKMDDAAATIPEYLFKDLKEPGHVVLTPGEIFGAARLWSLITKQAGGDPLEIIQDLQSEIVMLESQIEILMGDK